MLFASGVAGAGVLFGTPAAAEKGQARTVARGAEQALAKNDGPHGGAVAVFAGASPRSGTLRARTLVSLRTRIDEFAQDGGRIAWFAPDARKCASRLVVRSLTTGHEVRLGNRKSGLCGVDAGLAVALALAGDRVVYALESGGNTEVDGEVVTVAAGDRRARTVVRYAFEYGQGFPDPGVIVRGDGPTSVAIAMGQPLDPSDYGPCPGCNTLWRVDRDGKARRLSPFGAAVDIAIAGKHIAVATRTGSVELLDQNGHLIRKIDHPGNPEAVALSGRIVAVLSSNGRLAVYAVSSGRRLWLIQLPLRSKLLPAPLSAAGTRIVYSRGKKIFVADAATRRIRQLATAARNWVIGLSIEGNRVAWAENIGAYPNPVRGRIRAVQLR